MYRDASPSLEDTIARLESELREMRALGGKRRERQLVVTAVVSMMIAVHAVIGCVVTRVQAERVVGDASKRLEERSRDLITCIRAVDARIGEVDTCRTEKNSCWASRSLLAVPDPKGKPASGSAGPEGAAR